MISARQNGNLVIIEDTDSSIVMNRKEAESLYQDLGKVLYPPAATETHPWESKDIYLKNSNEGVILGLHSTGESGPNGEWHAMESWMNVYDLDMKFKYSAARIFGPLEDEAASLKMDGWVEFEPEV